MGSRIRLSLKYYDSARLKDAQRSCFIIIRWTMEYPDPEHRPLFFFALQTNLATPLLEPAAATLVQDRAERNWTERTALFRKIEALLNETCRRCPLSGDRRLAVRARARPRRPPRVPGTARSRILAR
jgi:hypothetical protein